MGRERIFLLKNSCRNSSLKAHYRGSSLSAWAIQGESFGNFQVLQQRGRESVGTQDGSTGRHHLFLLSFHLAVLVLVKLISVSFHPAINNIVCLPLLSSDDSSRDQAYANTPSCSSFQPDPVDIWTWNNSNLLRPSAVVTSQVCLGTKLTQQHLPQLLSTHHRRAHAASHRGDTPGMPGSVDQEILYPIPYRTL